MSFGLFLGLPAPLSAQFVDRAPSAGLNFDNPSASTASHSLQALDAYAVGSPACACDLDGDGWTDLIVARTGLPCLVFINNRDGTFREEAHARGLDTVSDIGGIAAGDLSNRGAPDIVMTPVAGSRYFLFVNDGTGRFTEQAVERGAAIPVTGEPHKGQSISLVDYDRDGYLDIAISEWSVLSGNENALHAVLLHNRGKVQPGFFENQTAPAGLVQPVQGGVIAGYATAWADFDGDGYPDVLLAGDFGTSQLWWNNGDGTFTNGTSTSGIANAADGMGIAVFDSDGDGKLDVFVSAISLTSSSSVTDRGFISDNKLFRYVGNRRFAETAKSDGVKESGWGWGVGQLDANNDGWPDLIVTNGWIGAGAGFASARNDPTKFFANRAGTYTDETTVSGIKDNGLGRSVVVLDYDNDGREDAFITQTAGDRILYHNEYPSANAHWLNLRFVGTASNRDGYGCEVTVTAGGRDRIALYNPTNAYIGQSYPRLHFGLGASTRVDRIRVKWPSGAVQELLDVLADQTIAVVETAGLATSPTITAQPVSVVAFKDDTVTLSVSGQGSPSPVYAWFKDGTRIPDQTGATLTLSHAQPIDAGRYTASLTNPSGTVTSQAAVLTVAADLEGKSVARWWNEALLDGIRKDVPNPPVHARNLYHVSAALWDAFWAYERDGWQSHREVFAKEEPALPADEPARLAAQRQAMSYAAYTVINRRFARSPGAAATIAGIRWLMQQYGYDPDATSTAGTSPSATGLRIGQRALSATLNDGANEANGYVDATGFRAVNAPLIVRDSGTGVLADPNYWQPLDLVNTVTQNGIVLGSAVQTFVGSNARNTQTFALPRAASGFPADDPGPPPRFGGSDYLQQAVQVLAISSQLSPTDGATLDISPGRLLNNPLGTNDGQGHALNPVTGQPYASNVVLRGDYARILAEFWADGPNSETPPGHWNVLFNQTSDHPLATRQFMGRGRPLRRLEWDVTGYLALNGALHDAACAAWALKWEYDSARPITMIRHLAGLGQSSDPSQPSYHVNGLPLIPGQIEVITAASSAPGQRHANLAPFLGKIAVRSWLGTPPSATLTSGVGWVLGLNWVPYQRDTFVTPAFPGYISGHSTFSRAGAEVLAQLTGSEFFPGGLATYSFAAGSALGFEAGPLRSMQLQWATYFDAADQAGLSRLYGGIHIAVDDFIGRTTGSKVGLGAFNRFLSYYATPAVATAAPTIVTPPTAIATFNGRTAVLTVDVTGSGPFTYQWMRGTTVVSTSNSLVLANLTGADAGDYTVTVRNSLGAVTSPSARLSVDGTSSFKNLSTRATVGPAERALIAGFVVRGATTKRVLVRGIGPGLTPYGLASVLPNPVLSLYDASQRLIARNDDWNADTTPASLFSGVGAFALTSGSSDAAMQYVLAPGSYTAVISDASGRSGTGLVEIYEADDNTNRLVNLSSRAFVGAGDAIGIAGFAVRGTQPSRYLIRGVGPSLASYGVNGVLAEPVLTVTTSAGAALAGNDGWRNDPELAAMAAKLGAFPLGASSRDAALLVTLAPGNYTVLVSGANGSTGIALVEVYELP